MTQLWFCKNCLIENALDFPKGTDVWTVVDAVRRDHLAISPACARTNGVPGIHLKSPLLGVDDTEYEQLKVRARERGAYDNTIH